MVYPVATISYQHMPRLLRSSAVPLRSLCNGKIAGVPAIASSQSNTHIQTWIFHMGWHLCEITFYRLNYRISKGFDVYEPPKHCFETTENAGKSFSFAYQLKHHQRSSLVFYSENVNLFHWAKPVGKTKIVVNLLTLTCNRTLDSSIGHAKNAFITPPVQPARKTWWNQYFCLVSAFDDLNANTVNIMEAG